MAITADIVNSDGTFVESYTGADYGALRAYATSKGLLVGAHGEPGGPGPTREVSSALLDAVFKEHDQASEHAQSPAVAALKAALGG